MSRFAKLSAAAFGLALALGATPSFANPAYTITVVNSTNNDIWITWYAGETYSSGQAGTSCVHPGGTATGDDAGDWSGYDPTVVRAELKAGSNCGGATLNHHGSWAGQDVWTGHVDKSGNMRLTITASGNNLTGSMN